MSYYWEELKIEAKPVFLLPPEELRIKTTGRWENETGKTDDQTGDVDERINFLSIKIS
jgi:hypothetical protein